MCNLVNTTNKITVNVTSPHQPQDTLQNFLEKTIVKIVYKHTPVVIIKQLIDRLLVLILFRNQIEGYNSEYMYDKQG